MQAREFVNGQRLQKRGIRIRICANRLSGLQTANKGAHKRRPYQTAIDPMRFICPDISKSKREVYRLVYNLIELTANETAAVEGNK